MIAVDPEALHTYITSDPPVGCWLHKGTWYKLVWSASGQCQLPVGCSHLLEDWKQRVCQPVWCPVFCSAGCTRSISHEFQCLRCRLRPTDSAWQNQENMIDVSAGDISWSNFGIFANERTGKCLTADAKNCPHLTSLYTLVWPGLCYLHSECMGFSFCVWEDIIL